MTQERILIIEDSMGVARALCRALSLPQGGDYQVETCESAEAALAKLHLIRFDLMISDLRLPGMNGLELLQQARQLRPEMRSMLITAYGSPQVEERARQLAQAYLPKPFHLNDLIRIVQRVLDEPVALEWPSRKRVPVTPDAADTAVAGRRPPAHLKVLACDLDGTLAQAGRVAAETWEVLRRAKAAGLVIILVTGRMLDSLDADELYAQLCEAIVAEDGAVVYFPRRDKVAMPFGGLDPVALQLLEALDVPLEKGRAIVATRVPYDGAILEVLRKVSGGATMEYNRGAVMVLPPGATKGTGLNYALRELGYSPHSVVACGDAENDRSLFEMAELAVAVANALPEVKALADIELSQANGAGVRAFVSDLLAGHVPTHRPRPHRRLLLGHRSDGPPVHLDPFVLVGSNLGIFGASGSGKSWLAGLLAEELLKQGYQVCIIDPEGDYRGMGAGPHTLLLGGLETELPSVADVVNFCESACVSLVLDLSVCGVAERAAYTLELIRAFRGLRARRGRPHWFLVDEVQSFCPLEGGPLTDLLLEAMLGGGFGLVSYRPSQVASPLLEALDGWLVTRLGLPEEIEALRPFLAGYAGGPAALSQLPTLPVGQAYLCLDESEQPPSPARGFVKFRVGSRAIPHIRHLHKYLRAPLPEHKMFYFHDESGRYLEQAAANLWEFRQALGELPVSSLQHHLRVGDFERWLQDVLHDGELARRVRKISNRDVRGEALRQELLEVVVNRYEELDYLI